MAICFHSSRFLNNRCRVSKRTLHRIGYIITSRPTAMGALTPTNVPRCSAGPVSGTRFARMMPIAIARMIQTTRKRSRKDNPLNGGGGAESVATIVSWLPHDRVLNALNCICSPSRNTSRVSSSLCEPYRSLVALSPASSSVGFVVSRRTPRSIVSIFRR